MLRRILLTLLLGVNLTFASGQQKGDTIIVELAKSSKVIFTIQDRTDLETLKHYDFQALFQDMLTKLETNDTSALAPTGRGDSTAIEDEVARNNNEEEDWNLHKNEDYDDDDDDDEDWSNYNSYDGNHWGRTWQSFNFDFGTNNYLEDGKFPNSNNDLYAVRPWGSWYVGLASIQRTRLAKKFFLEWGIGVNWYNFKFEEDNVLIQKDDDGIHFVEDNRDVSYKKSKLTASFLTASLIPVVDFGDNSRKARIWDGYRNSFRVGLGPYIGYRIESHSKLVYKDENKEKDKEHDSFYLNNIRWGLRLQLGYRSTDLFFNYDISELFVEGKGPDLNAFSFGVIF
jgi:hypothetical protein